MGFEPCRLGPCPVLKTCGEKLPQQPYRCYNCQHKRESRTSRPPPSRGSTSCAPLSPILDAEGMDEAGAIAPFKRAHTFPAALPSVFHPLPNVAKQPSGSVHAALQKRPSSAKPFKFSCQSSDHVMTPHYYGLPSYLPHQDHTCPPCQLEEMRGKGQTEAIRQAKKEYPSLTTEMLVRAGCIKEFQRKPTWDEYVDEKLTEDREMWHHVTRKWTQDLKRCRVLIAEEDGLGLFA